MTVKNCQLTECRNAMLQIYDRSHGGATEAGVKQVSLLAQFALLTKASGALALTA
jgi:hypothetical protein